MPPRNPATDAAPGPARFLVPPRAYLDASWLEHEQATLFDRSWALVAAAEELAVPGDYVEAVVGRCPLMVVRTEQNGLRAFHNLCRHRGMALVSGSGRLEGSIRCGYHGWRYGLEDGTLVQVPQRAEQFAGIDTGCWGLRAASVGQWGGMIFAHPDPEAAPFSEFAGDLFDKVGSYRPELLTQRARVRIEGRFNWKLFVENHIDVLHLWYLHDGTLGAFDHPRFEHHHVGPHWASYEPLKASVLEARQSRHGRQDHIGHIGHIEQRDRDGIGAHMLFPNILFASAADFWISYAVTPLAPDRSVIDLRVRAEPDADPEALVSAARAFIDEDVFACEQTQRALSSPRFAVGPLASAHEAPITTFQHHLLTILGDLTP
ncbi:MAG: aromatic ring-hydroxylating oxygenase subunit alpha [Acidimicrobiales bacterium]